MKKLIYSLIIGASAMLMGSCMEIDNFDEPGSHFTGRIIDKTTGHNILADQGENRVRIWEMSFSSNPKNQDIPVKQDGTYNNTKLFAGTYDVVPEGAFWPCDTIQVGLGSKKKTVDFEVTPYLKLVDFEQRFDESIDSLVLSCRLDVPPITEGLPIIMEVRPFISLNQFCGAGNNIGYYGKDDYKKTVMSRWDTIDKEDDGKSKVFTIKLDVKRGYTYFVRMGAKVRDTHQKFNYTEIVKIEIPQ